MKLNDWLKLAQKQLTDAGISTARLDCLVLLEDVLHRNRAYILAHPESKLTSSQQKILDSHLTQRINHIPLAYIRGITEFYGRDFIITKDVLEPRPESETMIELLKKLPAFSHLIDVGTGSGALAITAQLEFPKVHLTGVDIDPKCLKVAQRNAHKHSLDIEFKKSDLLSEISVRPHTALLCNLPYVPNKFRLNQAAINEPKIAIFGGEDGLDLYRTLFMQLSESTYKPDFVLTESLPFQHESLSTIAQQSRYIQEDEEDFIQVFKLAA